MIVRAQVAGGREQPLDGACDGLFEHVLRFAVELAVPGVHVVVGGHREPDRTGRFAVLRIRPPTPVTATAATDFSNERTPSAIASAAVRDTTGTSGAPSTVRLTSAL